MIFYCESSKASCAEYSIELLKCSISWLFIKAFTEEGAHFLMERHVFRMLICSPLWLTEVPQQVVKSAATKAK